MKGIRMGLSKKITALCLLLATVICVSVCITGYFKYRDATYQTYNGFAYNIAETALAYVDGDRITGYLETGETDAEYDEMARQVYTLYKNNDLSSIYICVPDPAKLTVATVYDARVHDAEKPDIYALGVVDPIGASDPQKVVDVYLTGERSESYFVRRTSFGYNTSAIVPVTNSAGQVVALLLADMPMPFIIHNLNEYMLFTIGITALMVFVLMFVYLSFLRRGVVMPIRLITESAEAFAHSRRSFSKDVAQIKTGDEIETLAGALVQMEKDIRSYIHSLAKVTADKERIATELAVATQIQTSMLPCIFPPFPDRGEFDIFAEMRAAKEVGGDFYDFFLIDHDHLGVVIADVSGKGVPAALFMVIAKTLIKNHAQSGMSPSEVFETVNDQLCENNEAGMFVTAFMGILEIETGRFCYVNAGHNPPLVSLQGKPFDWLPSKRGFVLAGMENMKYHQQEITFAPGDSLYLYTDGVTEALDPNERLYSEARLLSLLTQPDIASLSIEEKVRRVYQDIERFADGAEQADDITMLMLLVRKGGKPMAELTVNATLENLGAVSEFIEGQLMEAGCSMKTLNKVNIAAEEIYVNIARYAYPSGTGEATIRCGVQGDPREAVIRFEDSGTPYDPLAKEEPDVTASAEEREIGGLGVLMAKRLMDSVEYEYRDGRNILTMKKWLGDE